MKQKLVKNPNWQEADQFGYIQSVEEEDLTPGPPDYKSSALTIVYPMKVLVLIGNPLAVA